MSALSNWLGRACGIALALAIVTGKAEAQTGFAEIKGQVVGIRRSEEKPRAIPGVTVELRDSSGKPLVGPPFATPKTGEDGKFAIVEVPAGEYVLYAMAPGYAPSETKLYCSRDSVTQITIRLEQSNAGVEPGKKGPQCDQLPGAGKVTWDVKVFEESPLFHLVRREVKGRKICWLLENTETNINAIYGYRANLLDADGVKIGAIELKSDLLLLNTRPGERNRFYLTLPDQVDLRNVVRIVLARN